MFRTTFIGVTGSLGKTTCKELIAEVLASRYPTMRTRGNHNHYSGISFTILRTRPWHRYSVVEIGLDRPGQMDSFARALRPDIAVWVSVARTHTMTFRTLETTAREKSRLIEWLRPGGVAVLNDDNPYIAQYQPPPFVRTVYCGATARSAIKATNSTSRWPDRLTFRVRAYDEEVELKTRFVGEHWVGSILPAIAVGQACGIPLEAAAAAIAAYEPMQMRLSPVTLPNGATLLRDELNGSVDTMAAAIKVLEEATAQRKMIVFTDVSDSPKKPRQRVRDVGIAAARIADAAIFLGEHCERGARGAIAAGMAPDQVWTFYNIQDAALHLRSELRSGDLVLLRGRRCDHLARIYLSLTQEVNCWRNHCTKFIQCEKCPELKNKRKAPREEIYGELA